MPKVLVIEHITYEGEYSSYFDSFEDAIRYLSASTNELVKIIVDPKEITFEELVACAERKYAKP